MSMNSSVPGRFWVTMALVAPLMVNLAPVKVPEVAVPATVKIIVSPEERAERSEEVSRLNSLSKA